MPNSPKRLPPKAKNIFQSYHWLELAEYIALAASALGIVATLARQHVAFAATPIAFTLMFNIANRERLDALHKEQLNRQKRIQNAALIQVDQQLAADIRSLRDTLESFTPSSEVDPAQIQELMTTLEKKSMYMMDKVYKRCVADVNILRQELATSSSKLTGVSNNLSSAPTELDNMRNSSQNLAQMQIQIDQVKQQLEALDQKNQTIVKPYLQRLSRDVKHLQSMTAPIAQMSNQLTLLTQEFNNREERQQVQDIHTTVEQLQEAIAQLHEKIAHLESEVGDGHRQRGVQSGSPNP